MSSNVEPAIVARRQGRIGRLTINRPKVFNAVDHAMLCAIRSELDRWRDDSTIHAVVIEGTGDRAFCVGGDIRQVRDLALVGRYADIDGFFVDEYSLNLAIARYPKPYIALIDGACMGGGMGLAVHGSARVVTDAALLAMPETGIGFFPDVGASFFLPRLRPGYGMFLALIGTRVGGTDAAYLGLATHYVPHDRMRTLADEIAEDGPAVLAGVAVPPPPGAMPELAETVRIFDVGSVAEIMERLAALDTQWARETLATLRSMSPTAVLWTFELLQRGIGRSLEQCLAAELALTRHAIRHPDFTEGVRAMVVDKDRTPHWSPARLEDVDAATVTAPFR